jgi:hypothetical protein
MDEQKPSHAQKAVKDHLAYVKDSPRWARAGLAVVNRWGQKKSILQHEVALALEDAYNRGKRGEPMDFPEEPHTAMVRRTRPVQTPEQSHTKVVRRQRGG